MSNLFIDKIIYFVRHGETEWNKKMVIQGHKDSPLTLKGRNNAEKLGRILHDKNIEIIYSIEIFNNKLKSLKLIK